MMNFRGRLIFRGERSGGILWEGHVCKRCVGFAGKFSGGLIYLIECLGFCLGEIFRWGVLPDFYGVMSERNCPGWVSRFPCRIRSFYIWQLWFESPEWRGWTGVLCQLIQVKYYPPDMPCQLRQSRSRKSEITNKNSRWILKLLMLYWLYAFIVYVSFMCVLCAAPVA